MSDAILITGGTGFVGSAVIRRLYDLDYRDLIATVRDYGSKLPIKVRSKSIGEICATTNWTASLSGVSVVVHCAAHVHIMRGAEREAIEKFREVNVRGTMALARQAAKAGVRRFIFISSIKVNGESTCDGASFCHDDEPAPKGAYAISKFEAEQALFQVSHDTGLEVVIIRPPLIYGPAVSGNFLLLKELVKRGFPLPLGAINNRRSLLAVQNMADFVALCADPKKSPKAANKIFLISDTEPISTTELLQLIARAYGRSSRLIPVPQSWVRLFLKLCGMQRISDRLINSMVVDSSRANDLLGWAPIVSIEDQLAEMVDCDISP